MNVGVVARRSRVRGRKRGRNKQKRNEPTQSYWHFGPDAVQLSCMPLSPMKVGPAAVVWKTPFQVIVVPSAEKVSPAGSVAGSPFAPVSPVVNPKLSTAFVGVPAFTTVGVDPGGSAVTVPIAIVAF